MKGTCWGRGAAARLGWTGGPQSEMAGRRRAGRIFGI